MIKNEINDLAVVGGSPLFSDVLHVGCPNIGNRHRFITRIEEILHQRRLTNNGPFVQELEQKLAKYLGVKHCVAVCNATIALEIVARALGLRGEVIVPSFTFIATAHSLQWLGIIPVFCDIDPVSQNIDPRKIESLITQRTTGILGVHVWGRSCDVEKLGEIAQEYQLKLIFDAAHALGCTHRGQMIGNFGDAEVFSFHATKFFNTFEGGAITTNNDALAQKIRGMRNFGFAGLDNVIDIGTNGKMSEISAAMGLTSLESLDEFVKINRRNYLQYVQELEGIRGIRFVKYDGDEKNNYQYMVIEVDEAEAGIGRDMLVKILHAENVLVRRYFYPGCHQMEPYRSYFPSAGKNLPETEKLTLKVLQFPTGTAITEQEINLICGLVKFIIANGIELSEKLES